MIRVHVQIKNNFLVKTHLTAVHLTSNVEQVQEATKPESLLVKTRVSCVNCDNTPSERH